MLDKQGVYDCLRDHHIDFEITDHAPLFSMDDKPDVELPYPEWDAKIYLSEIISGSITI